MTVAVLVRALMGSGIVFAVLYVQFMLSDGDIDDYIFSAPSKTWGFDFKVYACTLDE